MKIIRLITNYSLKTKEDKTMLVLSRKENQKIRIDSEIIINVISISENQVKIGIEAPKNVKILRDEIYEGVRKHNVDASIQSKQFTKSDLKSLPIEKLNKK